MTEDAAKPKPLSVLVAGAGTMARVHATALGEIDGVELAGIVNEHMPSAKRLAAEFGTRAFKDLTQALRVARADAVFVCLPTPLHRAAVTEAASAGLHVFCEKPMARSVADAEAMIEVCAKENVIFMVGHVLRFFPQYAKLYDRVAKGDVGKPAMARLSRGGAAPRGARGWYAKRADSGGVLLDLVIHDFDWLLWTFGPVVRVHARQTAPRAGELASYALAVLRHESGVISHVEGFWGHELPFRTRVEVAGDKGALEYDSLHPIPVELHQTKGPLARAGVVLPESPLAKGPFQLEDEHFVDCVRRRAARDPVSGKCAASATCQPGRAVVGTNGGGRMSLAKKRARRQPSVAPKPLRIGMLHFAHFHSYEYAKHLAAMPGVSISGVADRDADRGREAAARLSTRYFPSVDALLRDKPDAVLVSSENARHETDVAEAASAGIHVFCEKPIATTMASSRRMIDVCRKAGVVLQVAFPVRFSPPVQRAREIVRGGSIGKILAANTTNRGRLVRTWFAEPELSGGGAVMDHTVHVLDLLRWILADDVVEVYAEADRLLYPDLRCEDCGLLSMKFKKGAIATLDTSWSRLPSFPTWGDVVMRFWGEKGTLDVDAFSQNVTVWGDAARLEGWGSNCDEGMMADFVATLRSGKEPTATAHDAMKALEVAVGAYESVRTGKPVRLPLG